MLVLFTGQRQRWGVGGLDGGEISTIAGMEHMGAFVLIEASHPPREEGQS